VPARDGDAEATGGGRDGRRGGIGAAGGVHEHGERDGDRAGHRTADDGTDDGVGG
jgi:hypothetical protein